MTTGDYNVFAVDWSKMAAAPWYNAAARNTKTVAGHTAQFIDYLILQLNAFQDFHLVGFSLGAHVAGMTGQFVTSGKLRRITGISFLKRKPENVFDGKLDWFVEFSGLDPARVLFISAEKDSKLDKNDAGVVEVIHTSGGYLAFKEPIGHRDFYPNGGTWPQPGCDFDFLGKCPSKKSFIKGITSFE